jgi:hypothetical protein
VQELFLLLRNAAKHAWLLRAMSNATRPKPTMCCVGKGVDFNLDTMQPVITNYYKALYEDKFGFMVYPGFTEGKYSKIEVYPMRKASI